MIYKLDADESIIVQIRNEIRLTILPGTGATATYSPVDSSDASAHDLDNDISVTAKTTIDVEWPFYRISVTGGTARVGLV